MASATNSSPAMMDPAPLLAVVVGVSSRLLFTTDRALVAESDRAMALGAQGELLSDLGRDLRGASRAIGGGEALTVGGVAWRASEGGTVRSIAGRPDQDRNYRHVRARFTISGSVVGVELTSPAGEARTAFYLRG